MDKNQTVQFLTGKDVPDWKNCFDKNWLYEDQERWQEIKDNIKGVTCDLRLGEEAYLSVDEFPR